MKFFDTIIDAAAARGMSAEEDCVVLDCRFDLGRPESGREAFGRGRLPGARYAHLEENLSSPATERSGRHPLPSAGSLSRRLSDWGIGPETQVIAYDDVGGLFAARAWWMLHWLGHDRAAVLDGGIAAWTSAGFALSTTETRAAAASRQHGGARTGWVCDSSDVRRGLDDGGMALVDARSAERFDGIREPIDRIAGHVPGAVNRPAMDNLDARGRFKPRGVLLEEWRAILRDPEERRIVSMCGSGVTACHNLLSLKIAGFVDCALYAGSWSAWISDPDNPTESGGNVRGAAPAD